MARPIRRSTVPMTQQKPQRYFWRKTFLDHESQHGSRLRRERLLVKVRKGLPNEREENSGSGQGSEATASPLPGVRVFGVSNAMSKRKICQENTRFLAARLLGRARRNSHHMKC